MSRCSSLTVDSLDVSRCRAGAACYAKDLVQLNNTLQSYFYLTFVLYLSINIVSYIFWTCVWQPTPRTADVTVTKTGGYVCARILMTRWFSSYFWHSYFLRYGHFVEYMNMHAMNMWLTDWCKRPVIVGADWTLHPWRHNNVGVSLRAR